MPVGISVDSVYCHANWAKSLGGVSFPLLADFHPKGSVAESFGAYLSTKGITDRATVIIDASGVVKYSVSVGPGGERDMEELAVHCEKINAEFDGELSAIEPPAGLSADATLYVKSSCGFSRTALMARENLHLGDSLPVKNISEDAAAKETLLGIAGGTQVPCLVEGGQALLESADIVRRLVTMTTGYWPEPPS